MNNFQIKAVGWCIRATICSLSKDGYASVKKWCDLHDHEYDSIPGEMGEEFSGCYCSDSDTMELGCVPLLDLNRLFLFNKVGRQFSPMTTPLIRNSSLRLRRSKSCDLVKELKPRYNKLLACFKETKGTGAVWNLRVNGQPDIKDFSISYSKFSMGSDVFYFISRLDYQGIKLERDHTRECLSEKVSYCRLL